MCENPRHKGHIKTSLESIERLKGRVRDTSWTLVMLSLI